MAMPDPVSTMAAVHSTLPVAEFVWLLLLASITTIVARWIPVPHTVALVLVGLLVSAAGLLRVGSDTIGPAITSMAHDPTFIAVLWVTGAVKLLGGFLALALARRWSRMLPRWILLTSAWGGGMLMAVYGGASCVQEGLMVAGVLRIPAELGHTAALWHVLFWDPWWLLGGMLFIIAAWSYGRRTRDREKGTAHGETQPGNGRKPSPRHYLHVGDPPSSRGADPLQSVHDR